MKAHRDLMGNDLAHRTPVTTLILAKSDSSIHTMLPMDVRLAQIRGRPVLQMTF